MNFFTLIKKFVNEGEVVEEELTGELAIDPIVSYKSNKAKKAKQLTKNIDTPSSQIAQKTKNTSKSTNKSKTITKQPINKVKIKENEEPEL